MNTKDPFNTTPHHEAYCAMRVVQNYADEWLVRELTMALEAGPDREWETHKTRDGKPLTLPDAYQISEWLSGQELNGIRIHEPGQVGYWQYANSVAEEAMRNHLLSEMEHLHKAYPPLNTEGPQLTEDDPAPLYPTIGQRPSGNLCTAMPDIQEWLDASDGTESEISKMLEVEISYNDLRMSQQ